MSVEKITSSLSHRVGRRTVLKGLAAGGALVGLGFGPARAAGTTITFVGWEGYDAGLSASGYLSDNDITLNTTYIGSNDEILAKINAGGRGVIDIVTPYMGYVPLMIAAGMLEPIDASKVPNLEKVLPIFKNDPNITVDGQLYAVPFTWGGAPMVYDPTAFAAAPTSWRDLEKPELEGKFGFSDDPLGNITLAAIIATDAEVATQLTPEQLKQAVDYMIYLKGRARLVATSWGELADALARGDIIATYAGWETMTKFTADKGKKTEYVYPVEGTYGWLDNYCIVKGSPNVDVAHALSNEIIGVPAQTQIGDEFVQGIVNEDAIAQLDPAARAVYPYGDLSAFIKKAKFFPFPPLEDDGVLATFERWLGEYERFKAA